MLRMAYPDIRGIWHLHVAAQSLRATAIRAITDFMDPRRFDVQEREVTWRTVRDF